jgi:nitroimidazol reductase NimA-like FMN-containing flavoprotein (pyridoxamine 5'-phosphate oxidase superfamily)
MYHDLTQAECRTLFEESHYAHLGCYDGTECYVLPITYLFHDGYLYSFTQEGKKIDIMGKHPNVCVQVERVESGFTWKSAIAWGPYERVTDPVHAQEMKLMLARQFGKITLRERKVPVSPMIADLHTRKEGETDMSIIYRIKPIRMTGKSASLQ